LVSAGDTKREATSPRLGISGRYEGRGRVIPDTGIHPNQEGSGVLQYATFPQSQGICRGYEGRGNVTQAWYQRAIRREGSGITSQCVRRGVELTTYPPLRKGLPYCNTPVFCKACVWGTVVEHSPHAWRGGSGIGKHNQTAATYPNQECVNHKQI
jgi:hypothetical protein